MSTAIQIEAAAIAQLQALGYVEGDTVNYRAFYPAGSNKADQGRKVSAPFPKIPQMLHQWNQHGMGIYFVVNQGGHTNAEITSCVAIFYEHDDLEKDLSRDLWQSIGLPEPTLQVDTGGKSIHSYWRLESPINSMAWRKLQTDLLEYADADRSLKNASRVMRLAGFAHASGQQSAIVTQSGKAYSYEGLRGVIPAPVLQQESAPITTSKNYSYQDDMALARELLTHIPRRAPGSGTYEDSLKVLAALTHKFGPDAAVRLAREWSPDEDWDENLDRKVNSLKGTSNPVTFGTLVKMAKDNGWKSQRQVESETWTEQPKTLKQSQESQVSQENGYAELRLAIAGCLALEDPIEREFVLHAIKDRFRKPLSLIRRVVKELTQVKEAIKTEFSIEDLENLGNTGVDFLIPRFLPESGLVMLGGFAKDGKSKLLYDLIGALVLQRPFLGFMPKRRARVLFIQEEERPHTMANNLEGVGILFNPNMAKDALVIKKGWEIDDYATLERWIAEHKPDVICFDSFKALNRNTGVSENAPEAANPVYMIQGILHRHGKAGVIIHHTSKNKEAQGIQRLGGSGALPAACDNIIMMSKMSENQESGVRLLSLYGRELTGRFQVEIVSDEFPNYEWKLLQEVGHDAEATNLQQRVLASIRQNLDGHPEGLTAGFLKECLGLPKDNKSIYKALDALTQSQAVTCTRAKGDRRVRLYGIPGYFLAETYTQRGLEKVSIDQKQDTNPDTNYVPQVSQDNFWAEGMAKGSDPIAFDGNVAEYRRNAAPALPVRNPGFFQQEKEGIQDNSMDTSMDTFSNVDTVRDVERKYPMDSDTRAHENDEDDCIEISANATVTISPRASATFLGVVDRSLPYPHRKEIPVTSDRPDWHEFERAIISSSTWAELTATKALLPEGQRVACMDAWKADGRYPWLESKVQFLKAQTEE